MAVVAGADVSQSLAAWVVFVTVLIAVPERELLLDRSEPAVVGPIEEQQGLESSFLASRAFEAGGNQRKRGGPAASPADSRADSPADSLADSLADNFAGSLGDNPALPWGSAVEEQLAGVAEVSLSQPV